MIFFNLISLQDSSQYTASHYYRLDTNLVSPNKSSNRSMGLAYIFKKPEELSDSKKMISEKKFIQTSPSREFLNSLWQQDIFLSMNHRSLYKYNMDIHSVDILKHQRKQKSLLSKFGKALFYGSIQCSLTSSLKAPKKTFFSINYSWTKAFRSQMLKAQSLLSNRSYPHHIYNIQNLLEDRVNVRALPVFTISNHLGQMIISEPSREYFGRSHIKNAGFPINQRYHGFFFVNYEDAKEYLQYIQHKYNLEKDKLNIFACDLTSFYRVMGSFGKDVSFRLIPDLKELSFLLEENKYKKNLAFHENQKQGRRSFQGQPLYCVKYSEGVLSHTISNIKYTLLFTNYNEALKTANILQLKSSPSLLEKPRVIVYNLEQFIFDQSRVKSSQEEKFLIVPSKSSYLFTKKNYLYKKHQLVYNKFAESISYMNLWLKRVFWSLTSRKPI